MKLPSSKLIAVGGPILGIVAVLVSKISVHAEIALDIFFLVIVISFGVLVEVSRRRLRSKNTD